MSIILEIAEIIGGRKIGIDLLLTELEPETREEKHASTELQKIVGGVDRRVGLVL